MVKTPSPIYRSVMISTLGVCRWRVGQGRSIFNCCVFTCRGGGDMTEFDKEREACIKIADAIADQPEVFLNIVLGESATEISPLFVSDVYAAICVLLQERGCDV